MTPAMVQAAVQAGLFWTDGVRTVVGEGKPAPLEVAAGDAGSLIRDAIAAGAPGAFFSAAFDPLEPTTVLIPDELRISSSGTSVGVAGGTRQAELEAVVSESATVWSSSVQEAADAVASPAHALAKVVLARQHQVTFREAPEPIVVLGRLMRTFPKAFHFSIASIVGASPELLGQVFDGQFSARALAGTVSREADPIQDVEASRALLASSRYQHEHALLARYLGEHLAPFIDGLAWERQPKVLTLPNVHHLMTTFTGTVVPALQGPGGLIDVLASIHPTPAIAGVPTETALGWIRDHETSRGRLGGYVGWTDANGDGQAALAIRCLELDDLTARLVVGNGIVGDSEPHSEVLENQAKARGVLEAVTTL